MNHKPAPEGLYEPYRFWREAALADGWIEIPGGPWGIQDREKVIDPRTGQLHQTGERREGDRSIKLLKEGFQIWLVDQDSDSRPWMTGWFNNNHMLLNLNEKYNWDDLINKTHLCTRCGYPDPKNKPLRPYSFAGMACSMCDTPEFRAQVEFPGWAD